MKNLLFVACMAVSCMGGQLWAFGVVSANPVVAECSQPPEVERMVQLMASMPLNIKVTETGNPPDEIAALIGGLK